MVFSNFEAINECITSHSTLYLATSISGLPSVRAILYTSESGKKGFAKIFFTLEKQAIEYNQIMFNQNCCIAIGSQNQELKLFGKVHIVKSTETQGKFENNDEKTCKFTLDIETIMIEKDGTIIQTEQISKGLQKQIYFNNMKSEAKYWFQITRAPFFTATIMPILLGIVLAYVLNNVFSIQYALLTLMAGLAIHTGTNLINDYFDQRTDNLNENYTPFNGGSRTIQLRLASQEKILTSAIIGFLIGSLVILYLAITLKSVELLGLLLFGMLLAYFYSAGPVNLSHHGLGEISNFLGYGPVLTLSAWLIETQGENSLHDVLFVLFWSLIPGLLLALILLINEFQDYESDKQAGKKTLIVRIGKNNGKVVYDLINIINFILIGLGVVIFFKNSAFVVISFLGLIFFYKASKLISKNKDKIEALLPANALTVQNHLITNTLVILGFILTKIVTV